MIHNDVSNCDTSSFFLIKKLSYAEFLHTFGLYGKMADDIINVPKIYSLTGKRINQHSYLPI